MILQVQLASKGIPLIYVKSLDLHQALDRTGMLDGCLRNMLQDNLGFVIMLAEYTQEEEELH